MDTLIQIGSNAKKAAKSLAKLDTDTKNNILKLCAKELVNNKMFILEENEKDVKAALEAGIKGAFIDRLTLNEKRIDGMAEGLTTVAALDDPLNQYDSQTTRPNGLIIAKKRIPLGVLGIIFEARPNVSADSFALCFKSGNAVILRGGKEALRSNMAVVSLFRTVISKNELNPDFVQIISDTSRETAVGLMKLNGYIDVLIPRGGTGLIRSVVENSSVPVIQTGSGNCHIFVDESADFEQAIKIIVNAKTQRPGVCNACEKLLVHERIAEQFLPLVCEALYEKNVEIRGDNQSKNIIQTIIPAQNTDWETEYEDLIIAIKTVSGIEEAIEHIEHYSTSHSEAILTQSYENALRFQSEVSSAAVYVNASTRFTDGAEFGFGAEIGISTQKLHARGPMGLYELTTSKYIVYGSGQIRN